MSNRENYLLELKGLTKSFPGVLANDQVDLTISAGDVHALLGENGAGKSTLVKMIYGILKPDVGQIYFEGELVEIDSPATARRLGVAMVFQHFSLFDSLTVVENISLGMDHDENLGQLAVKIQEISDHYGLPLDPHRHVYTLSVGERQRIEIIRCLLQEPKLLVMDEPTSVLTPQEVDKLFVTLRRLADEGMAILYISHKLDEIKTLCHHATVLRLGKKVAAVTVEEETTHSLAHLMMGEALQILTKVTEHETGPIRLKVTNLNAIATHPLGISLENINLQVSAGEVVGIAGVAGNGQDELLRVLNGEVCNENASCIEIDGKAVAHLGANDRREAGLASVPEKRLGHGAIPDMDLLGNAFMTSFKRLKLLSNGIINFAKTAHFTDKIIGDYSVKTTGSEVLAESLSGGNLQKFIIGRELLQKPDILIVSQPTWGVDAGAALAIRLALRALAAEGAAVLVISQDLDELMEICDRIGAICAGKLSPLYDIAEMTVDDVGMLMAGVEIEGDKSAA